MKLKQKTVDMAGQLRCTAAEVAGLLHRSWKPVLAFSVLYAAVFLFLVISLRDFGLWLNTRLIGVRYVSPDNLKTLLLAPSTILTVPVLCVGLVFTMAFQIGGLDHAYTMAQIGNSPTMQGMVIAGAECCLRYLNPKNWLVIPLLLVLMPLTSFMALSSSSISVVIPGFILDAVGENTLYSLILMGILLTVYLLIFGGIFSMLIFQVQNIPFDRAYQKSWHLARRHYMEMLFSVLLANVALFVISTAAAAVAARIYSVVTAWMVEARGLLSAEEIGRKLYILSDLFSAFAAPIVNNAVLTVLFFKYHEQEGTLADLSPRSFVDRAASRALLAAVGSVLVLICGYCVYRYGGTMQDILEPSERPGIVAHRGDSTRAPENTLPAFELTLPEQPEWVELDVHETKDGVIVVSHDDDLSRVAGKKLFIHDLTYEELAACDVGSWFDEEFSDVRISTLDEVLKLYKDTIPVQIEIKPTGYETELEEHVLQVVRDNGMADQVILTCLQPQPLQRVKQLAPEIRTAYSMFVAWGHIEEMDFSDCFSIEEGNVTKSLVDQIHRAGKRVFAWTVNSEDHVQYLVDCGVDGILTDDPIMLDAALNQADYSGGLAKAVRFITAWMVNGT